MQFLHHLTAVVCYFSVGFSFLLVSLCAFQRFLFCIFCFFFVSRCIKNQSQKNLFHFFKSIVCSSIGSCLSCHLSPLFHLLYRSRNLVLYLVRLVQMTFSQFAPISRGINLLLRLFCCYIEDLSRVLFYASRRNSFVLRTFRQRKRYIKQCRQSNILGIYFSGPLSKTTSMK